MVVRYHRAAGTSELDMPTLEGPHEGPAASLLQMGLDPRLPNHRRVFSCSAVPLGLQWLFSTFSAFFKPSTRDGRCGQLRSQPVSSSSGTPRRPAPAAPLAPGRAAGSGPRRAAWRPSSPRLGPCNPLSSPVFREDANARGRLGCHPLRIRACVQGGPE